MRQQLIICLFSLIASAAFAYDSPPIKAWLSDDALFWQVEVVSTEATRAKGLMYRPYLLPHYGMLFVFEKPREVSFWMRNTWLTLDMRFFDAKGKLITHYPYAAPCITSKCRLYPAQAPVKYVLETAAHYSLYQKPSDIQLIISESFNDQ